MSVELISVLIAMLAVGATLGGLILTGNRGLRQDHEPGHSAAGNAVARGHQPVTRRHGEAGISAARRHQATGDRVGRMEHSQAKLEGLLEGLREAISGRAAAS